MLIRDGAHRSRRGDGVGKDPKVEQTLSLKMLKHGRGVQGASWSQENTRLIGHCAKWRKMSQLLPKVRLD